MKVKINNKTYNTDTGQRVCQCAYGYLYKRYHSIDYFLHDPLHRTITPVSWNEARDLAYKYAPGDLYKRLFIPRMDQGRTNIDLPREHYDKLRVCAGLHGNSVKGELRAIIEKAYRNRDRHKQL